MPGILDQVSDSIESAANSAFDTLTGGTQSPTVPSPEGIEDFLQNGGTGPQANDLWAIEPQNWYKIFGYRFTVAKATNVDSVLSQTRGNTNGPQPLFTNFTLPIPPQSLIVKPIFPSKVTPTLGGVVEETSPVKFWMVSMSGTTGTSIGRVEEDRRKRNKMATVFRDTIETTGLLANAAQGLEAITNQVGGFIDTGRAVEAFGENPTLANAGVAVGAVTGAYSNTLLPPTAFSKSAVDGKSNGFSEAHELQKFFYLYNGLKADKPSDYALLFTNFKTDQTFRCVVKDFNLQVAADNPHLYKYQIQLQCWDVSSSSKIFQGDAGLGSLDRFATGADLESVDPLTARGAHDLVAGQLTSIVGL